MDNNQPYNNFDEQFNDLPLPGEEQSWQEMKKLLDEEDKNRRPLAPVFLRTCAGWGLALMLIVAATWVLLKPQKWGQQKETSIQTEKKSIQDPYTEKSSRPPESGERNPNNSESVTNGVKTGPVDNVKTTPAETFNSGPATSSSGTVAVTKPSGKVPGMKNNTGGTIKTGAAPTKRNQQKSPGVKNTNITKAGVEVALNNKPIPPDQKSGGSIQEPGASTNQPGAVKSQQKDSSKKSSTRTRDSLKKKQPSADSLEIEDIVESGKEQLLISAGIGLQQQIPLGGQKAVPYDYYGRTGSLSDYIPSVYLRVEKEEKWFVQGEFRYGAPQTLADFQYSRQTKIDSQNMTVTSFRLKKTYYHQLPLSFNYYVLPNFSVGVGGIYSRFHGAVSEKEVKKTDLQTQVETMSREIVNLQHFNDSFLYKTQVHALIQAEYHWKRFDFGLRYTKDVQPYIKYTQPDGHIDVKKNQTFQLLIRFRIWNSRDKFSG